MNEITSKGLDFMILSFEEDVWEGSDIGMNVQTGCVRLHRPGDKYMGFALRFYERGVHYVPRVVNTKSL